MKTLNVLGLISFPLLFLFAGLGMLWLLPVDTAPNFFEQWRINADRWVEAHIILLIGTMFMIPSSIAVRSQINDRLKSNIATIMVVIVALTVPLLVGQYAIDFVNPYLANAGADGANIYNSMQDDVLITTLFYGIPNLVFLALIILSFIWLLDSNVARSYKILLTINLVLVLVGNLIHPMFQRTMILCVSITLLPFLIDSLKLTSEWKF